VKQKTVFDASVISPCCCCCVPATCREVAAFPAVWVKLMPHSNSLTSYTAAAAASFPPAGRLPRSPQPG
jgi:hypothetical protein